MRIIGIMATYNEELVIKACIEHHLAQGIEIYLIDNGSTDKTVAIARQFIGHGLIAIESITRKCGLFDLKQLLKRKQELARSLDANWFIHLDADEMRLPPSSGRTLALALGDADTAGYNAVNFLEFTFIPTGEAPNHEHARFQETMRWYYAFLPRPLHRVNAWKKQSAPVDLLSHSGHFVIFPKQFIYPLPFRMRHYQFLSIAHAVRKYAQRHHPAEALAQGKHGWREHLDPTSIKLPSRTQLHEVADDGWLDFSSPRSRHFLDNRVITRGKPVPAKHSLPDNFWRIPTGNHIRASIIKKIKHLRHKP